jgi:hypothetical protein
MSLKNEVFTATIDPTIRSDTKELMISCGDDKLVPSPFPPPRAAEGGVGVVDKCSPLCQVTARAAKPS